MLLLRLGARHTQTNKVFPQRYDLTNANNTVGLTVFAADKDESTLLSSGRIFEGEELTLVDGVFEGAAIDHSPEQLRNHGEPIIFYGRGGTSHIEVAVKPPLTDPDQRRAVVGSFAAYATLVTYASENLNQACTPFGVTRTY